MARCTTPSLYQRHGHTGRLGLAEQLTVLTEACRNIGKEAAPIIEAPEVIACYLGEEKPEHHHRTARHCGGGSRERFPRHGKKKLPPSGLGRNGLSISVRVCVSVCVFRFLHSVRQSFFSEQRAEFFFTNQGVKGRCTQRLQLHRSFCNSQ